MDFFDVLLAKKLGGGGGADVSGVTATAADVDTGKVFVDSTGTEVTGTSTYKADYITLNDNINTLNNTLEPVIMGNGSGGGLTVDSVIGLIDRSITSFNIPDGTTSIGQYLFYHCDNLVNVNIPNSVTSINHFAFSWCGYLALTSLPNTITSIGNSAFSSCWRLALTSLPNTITSIGNSAFSSCMQLALTTLPSGLTAIGSQAFYNCTSLTNITFLGTPTTINSNAFQNCTNLTTIHVPWQEGEVANAPWGATNATIIYNYTA
jgi:hypothetical protein